VMQLSFALIGVSTVARLILGLGMHDGIPTRVNTLCNMDCIAAGAAVAVVMMMRTKEECARLSKVLLWAAAILFPIYAIFAFINTEVSAVFCPTVSAIGFSGLVIKTVLNPNSCRLFAHDFMKMVGKYSYGLYLFHYPIIYLISQHLVKPTWPAVAIFGTITLASWALVAPLAVLSFHFFETPFLKLKDKFEYFKA
jgi:peptidoglycan/LPS O-acetylase OafA/YrhL